MKKTIVLLLALVLCISLLPVAALAAEYKAEDEVALADIKVDDILPNGVVLKCENECDHVVYFNCEAAKHVYVKDGIITIENQTEVASASGLWVVLEAGVDEDGCCFISIKPTGSGAASGKSTKSSSVPSKPHTPVTPSVPATPLTPATPTVPACPIHPAFRKHCCVIKAVGCLVKEIKDCDLCDKLQDCAEEHCKEVCEQMQKCAAKKAACRKVACEQMKECVVKQAVCRKIVCEQVKACAVKRAEYSKQVCAQICENMKDCAEKKAECREAVCEQFCETTAAVIKQTQECNEAFIGGICKTIQQINDFNKCVVESVFGCCH